MGRESLLALIAAALEEALGFLVKLYEVYSSTFGWAICANKLTGNEAGVNLMLPFQC